VSGAFAITVSSQLSRRARSNRPLRSADPIAAPDLCVEGCAVLLIDAAHVVPLAILDAERTRVTLAAFAGLDQALLARVAPDIVALPLFGQGFDVLDALARLQTLGFAGRVMALAPPLPDPIPLLSDLGGGRGGLHVDLVEVAPEGQALRVTPAARRRRRR
jgi:hypothetical protein